MGNYSARFFDFPPASTAFGVLRFPFYTVVGRVLKLTLKNKPEKWNGSIPQYEQTEYFLGRKARQKPLLY